MEKHPNLGQYLRSKRLAAGLSQIELSKRLGYKTSQFVSNWELGRSSPPLSTLASVVKLLDIPKAELIEIMLAETKDELLKELSGKCS